VNEYGYEYAYVYSSKSEKIDSLGWGKAIRTGW